MKIVYVDCFAGVAGDMLVAAMYDLGLDPELLRRLPGKLGLPHLSPALVKAECHCLRGLQLQVAKPEVRSHRRLRDVLEIIDSGEVSSEVKGRVRKSFELLAGAEARVHGTSLDEVRFHEVGADDAIFEAAAYFAALEALGWPKVYSAAPVLGNGVIRVAHGLIPLPGPAVAEILKGVPVRFIDRQRETVTPTGAALLVASATFAPCPPVTVEAIGYGAGTISYDDRPNMVRVFLGLAEPDGGRDSVTALEVILDGSAPAELNRLAAELHRLGATEVYVTPVTDGRNQPDRILTIRCKKSVAPVISDMVCSAIGAAVVRLTEMIRLAPAGDGRPDESR